MSWIRVATSLAELERLRPYWEHLYNRGSYSLFQCYAWNRLAAVCFADRMRPHVVCCETAGGLSLIPAAIGPGPQLTFLGEEMFDYRDLLTEGDEESLHRAWSVLGDLGMPLTLQAITDDAALSHWQGFGLRGAQAAPQVYAAATSAEGFVRDHPLLARLWRKAQRAGIQLKQYEGKACDVVRFLCRQKAQEHTGTFPNLFTDPRRVDWLIAAAASDAVLCQIFTLECGSSIVAGVLTFLDFGVRRFYTICYDRSWGALSPGNSLLLEVTRRSLDQELDCDYMTGEQPYKLRLANGLMPLYRVEASAADLQAIGGSGQNFQLQAA